MNDHQPVVKNFNVRAPGFPEGHWMNPYWGMVARSVAFLAKMPFYRFVLRAEPVAKKILESGQPVIFACIHQDIVDCYNAMPRLFPDRQLAAMVSYSRDGNLASLVLQALGYRIVRGSSSRGGGEALLMMRSTLIEGGSIVFASDGPKAPLGDIKPGPVHLAARSNTPLLPVRAWGLNRFRFRKSWAKACFSTPFLPIVVCVGNPIEVPDKIDDTRPYQRMIASEIARLSRQASLWAGGPPVAPFTVSEI